MVRTALAIEDRALAEGRVAGLQPRYPYAEHAMVAANAALAEAGGDPEAAAAGYAEAADRWEQFGVVPEHAFALLGQGRCLAGLGQTIEAAEALRSARRTFERLRARPAFMETDDLLTGAIALGT